VDVDANPQLSAALQVQSIPMVLAVVGGQLVPGFLGALPEAQVRQWLGQVLQVAQQLGLPGTGAEPGAEDGAAAEADGQPGAGAFAEPELAEARQATERGDLDAAAAAFERLLAGDPGHPVAVSGLAQVNLFRRVNSYDAAAARRDAAAHPGDVAAQIRVADIEMAQGNAEEAFDRLLGVIRRTGGEDRNKVRQHLVGLFEIFPPRDPRVSQARSTLSSLLF
jgi:putative thioredoxin